jgi:hypothetical protein
MRCKQNKYNLSIILDEWGTEFTTDEVQLKYARANEKSLENLGEVRFYAETRK